MTGDRGLGDLVPQGEKWAPAAKGNRKAEAQILRGLRWGQRRSISGRVQTSFQG